MTVSRARRKFPQLANNDIKYCSVFYEGIHDDARTNLAIALTAAREGATMLNYCEVLDFIRERPYSKDDTTPNHVRGVIVKDKINNKIYKIKTKSVLFCGGPFTDELRRIEDPICDKVITGASGIHIVIPDYFAPNGFGMLDMNTSDGRFLFYLPWEGHVIIGTTDRKCEPTMRPIPPEDEIEWLLKEASKYLSPELKLSRNDVLSVWSGIRPLVKADPIKMNSGSFETAKASRDHMISYNSKSGTVFISGGKWTTYREM
jgi:glycerol-3-phosphate dehydrogenase